MTGAPKQRTMEIIDELEGEARGVYSGAIGYFGLGGALRPQRRDPHDRARGGRATIGAGGAIVMQSDPEDEYDEMLLKARGADAGDRSQPRPGAHVQRRPAQSVGREVDNLHVDKTTICQRFSIQLHHHRENTDPQACPLAPA